MAGSRFARWLQRLLMVVAAFGLVYLFLVMIQPYRFEKTLSEKRGSIVDSQTGHGIPDVVVVVNYQLESITPFQVGRGCIYQKIVRTDADGNYVVPDVSGEIDVADDLLRRMLPGFSHAYGWVVLYHKDGYVVAKDHQQAVDVIERRPVPNVALHTPYTKQGDAYIVPPVEMRAIDIRTPDVALDAYIVRTSSVARQAKCFLEEERNSEDSKRLQSAMKTSIRHVICGLPPDRVLPEQVHTDTFLDCAASTGLKKQRERAGDNWHLTAGALCESFRYVPDEYECQGPNPKRPSLRIATKLGAPSAKPSD